MTIPKAYLRSGKPLRGLMRVVGSFGYIFLDGPSQEDVGIECLFLDDNISNQVYWAKLSYEAKQEFKDKNVIVYYRDTDSSRKEKGITVTKLGDS